MTIFYFTKFKSNDIIAVLIIKNKIVKKTLILVLLIVVAIGGVLLLKNSFYNADNKVENKTEYSDVNSDINMDGETGIKVESPAISDSCVLAGGTWLKDFSQCEYIGENWCTENSGVFSECGSACRNDLEAEVCTLQCVSFCQFSK